MTNNDLQKQPKLIVIGGYVFSGKDAVANILVEEVGWYKTYMSKPLENALLTLDPYIPVNVAKTEVPLRYSAVHASVGYDESKKIDEVRRLLQTLGTEVGRNMFGPDSWLNLVSKEVTEQLYQGRNVVVTGVRYPNEMARFKDFEAKSLWVERPGVTAVNAHSSENTLIPNDFDMCCYNSGTLEDLKTWVVEKFK